MQTKYSVEDIANNILGEPMSWSYVFGEVKELIQDKTYSELSDVVATFSLALYKHFPRIGKWKPKHAQNAFQRWVKRKTVWKKIFEIHNLNFEKKCIKKGGNYNRDAKIKIALKYADYKGDIKWEAIKQIRKNNPE